MNFKIELNSIETGWLLKISGGGGGIGFGDYDLPVFCNTCSDGILLANQRISRFLDSIDEETKKTIDILK